MFGPWNSAFWTCLFCYVLFI